MLVGYPAPQPVVPIATFTDTDFEENNPWDPVTGIPGKWAKVNTVPEPSLLFPTSPSGVILTIAKRWKHRTRGAPQPIL